ncbi:MAG: hypothetical protein JWN99_134, partial [Ilumatobacteraceae bacterium]|nr:hypothetical protein [Ilumatobacteraceae bacterium]
DAGGGECDMGAVPAGERDGVDEVGAVVDRVQFHHTIVHLFDDRRWPQTLVPYAF